MKSALLTAFVAAAVSLLAFGMLACERTEPAPLAEPSGPYAQAKRELASDRAVLLDVRELRAWDSGHVDGATIFPLSWLQEYEPGARPNTIPQNKIIYVYGSSAQHAQEAADLLIEMGFDARAFAVGLDELETSFDVVRPAR